MLSNTRTWKTFSSNMRKGLRHYIKRVFQPKRPVCSQARKGPPALSRPAGAARPGNRHPPVRRAAEMPRGSLSCWQNKIVFHSHLPASHRCLHPSSSFWKNGYREQLRSVFYASLAMLRSLNVYLVRGGSTTDLFYFPRRRPKSV